MTTIPREDCLKRDGADPLAAWRRRFVLPENLIYLDGNSLGPLPTTTAGRLDDAVREEWGQGLIRSWNAAGWIDLPRRLGAKLAPLIGAAPHEVTVADSTSINLFKLLIGALRLRPDRRVIVSEAGNFPTDLYIAQGIVELLGGDYEIRYAEPDDIAAAIDRDVAVAMLTQVDFRSGRMHDMAAVTKAAQAAGALMLWDLAHSAGAFPVDLTGAGADFAVGCGYKYLNGGPGAPAFLFVAERHQDALIAPLSGWMGHARPFDFARDYAPAAGIDRQLCGTPPVLSMTALDAALDIWAEVDMAAVRAKSVALSDLFIDLVEDRCAGHGFALASPRSADARGSQVSFAHADGYAIMQALIARGVIGDFRAPDILRFGFAPLYLRYVDIWDAVEVLRAVMESRAWDTAEFKQRAAVT